MSLLEGTLRRIPRLEPCRTSILEAYEILSSSYDAGGKALICGNGGSAADAGHIVGELMKSFEMPRPLPTDTVTALRNADPEMGAIAAGKLQAGLPAIDLTAHTSLYTAFSNDEEPDLVFAQQVLGYGNPRDVVIGISTSGNSRNVVLACFTGKALGLSAIGLSGGRGGNMARWCDGMIVAPGESVAEIQEMHLPIYHTLCKMIEARFFGN